MCILTVHLRELPGRAISGAGDGSCWVVAKTWSYVMGRVGLHGSRFTPAKGLDRLRRQPYQETVGTELRQFSGRRTNTEAYAEDLAATACSALNAADADMLRALLAQLCNASSNLTLVLDPELQLQLANDRFHDLCGLKPEEAYGRPLSELGLGAWNAPRLQMCIQRLQAEGGGVDEVETPWRPAGSGPGVIRWRVSGCRPRSAQVPWLLLVGEWQETPDAASEGAGNALAPARERIHMYRRRLQGLASQLVLAEERARRQIAADLHDRIGQGLAAAQLQLGALRRASEQPAVRKDLERLRVLIDQVVEDTRNLTFEISPPVLYQVGLEAALEWLAEEYQKLHDLDVSVSADSEDKPLHEDVRGLLFRSARELLFNAVKHAQATHVQISVRRAGESIRLEVADDGIGCDVTALDGNSGEGTGLFSIRERMDSLGGALQLYSAPGQGLRCVLTAPLNRPD